MRRSFALLRITSALLLILASAVAGAQSRVEDEKAAIRDLLEKQVEAWNRHDLQGFMAGYWKSPDLTFFAEDSVISGWDGALQRYRNKYQRAGREMGRLDFFDLRVEPLAADAAFVSGHWRLQMKSGKQQGGLFTLILRKFPEGWKIVHDHTS